MSTATYHNLSEFLDDQTPYGFGRSVYKYTDCGPWVSYIVTDKPAHTEEATLEIIQMANQILVTTIHATSEEARKDALLCLGFNDDGTSKMRSLDRLERSIIRFENKIKSGKCVNPMMNVRTLGRNVTKSLRVELWQEKKATTKSVYYGDAPEQIENCIGVQVGSIVEGSDVEIDPTDLMFPFTEEQWEETVASINSDACAVWDWANEPKDKNGRKHRNGKTDYERGYEVPLF